MDFRSAKLTPGTIKYSVFQGEENITFQSFFEGLVDDYDLRKKLIDKLLECQFSGIRWELPPLTQETINRRCEFVLNNCPALINKTPSARSFRSYFKRNMKVATFPSLGKDCLLIVPCPENRQSQFGHLKSFLRSAGQELIHEFLITAAEQFLDALNSQPKWFNTAGLGVPWLHLRIDSRPKYYWHRPYKTFRA